MKWLVWRQFICADIAPVTQTQISILTLRQPPGTDTTALVFTQRNGPGSVVHRQAGRVQGHRRCRPAIVLQWAKQRIELQLTIPPPVFRGARNHRCASVNDTDYVSSAQSSESGNVRPMIRGW